MSCDKCETVRNFASNCSNITPGNYRRLVKSYFNESDPSAKAELRALHDSIDETRRNWTEIQAVAGFDAQAKYDIQEDTNCFSKRKGIPLNLYCDDELTVTGPWAPLSSA